MAGRGAVPGTGVAPGTRMARGMGTGAAHRLARGAALAGLGALCLIAGVQPAPALAQQARTPAAEAAARASARGWLGLSLRELATAPGAPGALNGVRLLVTDLYAGGPADLGGLRPGDLLVRINGAPAELPRFQSLASRLEPGDPLAFTVLRDGRIVELSLEAGQAPQREEFVRQMVQVQLDSARMAFAPRLDSLRGILRSLELQATAWTSAPRVEVAGVDGDSLRTLVVLTGADGSLVRVDDGRGVYHTLQLRAGTSSDTLRTGMLDPITVRVRGGAADSVAISGRLAREDALRAANDDVARRPLTAYLSGANRVAGAELRPVDEALGAYFGVMRGVLVLDVSPGTPAHRIGLAPGDVIVQVQGREVGGIEAFRTLLARSPGPVLLRLVRRGRTLDLTLPR
jgi:hypothetical protein